MPQYYLGRRVDEQLATELNTAINAGELHPLEAMRTGGRRHRAPSEARLLAGMRHYATTRGHVLGARDALAYGALEARRARRDAARARAGLPPIGQPPTALCVSTESVM